MQRYFSVENVSSLESAIGCYDHKHARILKHLNTYHSIQSDSIDDAISQIRNSLKNNYKILGISNSLPRTNVNLVRHFKAFDNFALF